MKKRRILVLMHPDLVPPAPGEVRDERLLYQGKTEIDEVRALGVQEELAPIREAVREMRPHVFSTSGRSSTISLTSISTWSAISSCSRSTTRAAIRAGSSWPATRRSPRSWPAGTACTSRISWSCRGGRRVSRPRGLRFPLIVKSLMDEGSFGIAQASIVDSDEKLADRVRFLHGRDADAIVEEYIEGREIYVGVLGNRRLEVLPIWELTFENLPAGAMAIATARVKHDPDYQERRGIRQQRAGAISPATEAAIVRTTRRIYRILSLDGYARLDYRLREDGTFFFLEGNPNPDLAQSQEFASVAEEAGLGYPALLERIVSLGMRRPVP